MSAGDVNHGELNALFRKLQLRGQGAQPQQPVVDDLLSSSHCDVQQTERTPDGFFDFYGPPHHSTGRYVTEQAAQLTAKVN